GVRKPPARRRSCCADCPMTRPNVPKWSVCWRASADTDAPFFDSAAVASAFRRKIPQADDSCARSSARRHSRAFVRNVSAADSACLYYEGLTVGPRYRWFPTFYGYFRDLLAL